MHNTINNTCLPPVIVQNNRCALFLDWPCFKYETRHMTCCSVFTKRPKAKWVQWIDIHCRAVVLRWCLCSVCGALIVAGTRLCFFLLFFSVTLLSPSELSAAQYSLQRLSAPLFTAQWYKFWCMCTLVCAAVCVYVCLWWLICINDVRRTAIKSWETVSTALSCDY